MPRSILVPHDGSSYAQAAFEYALETFPEAQIILFHAIDPFELTPTVESPLEPLTDQWLEAKQDDAEALFQDAIGAAGAEERIASVETDTAVGSPARAIIGYAEDADIDGVVMGGRGRSSSSSMQFGSAAEVVVKRVSVPVTVV